MKGEEILKLPTAHRFNRGGVIPYTIKANKMWFLLGIDRRTRDLTDFGGGVKAQESFLDTALREFHEESCGIFEKQVTVQTLLKSSAIVDKNKSEVIFFVCVDNDWLKKANSIFIKSHKSRKTRPECNEMIGLKWLESENFYLIVFRHHSCLWSKIKKLISENSSWEEVYYSLHFGYDIWSVIKGIIILLH